jgi:hypothetical protein
MSKLSKLSIFELNQNIEKYTKAAKETDSSGQKAIYEDIVEGLKNELLARNTQKKSEAEPQQTNQQSQPKDQDWQQEKDAQPQVIEKVFDQIPTYINDNVSFEKKEGFNTTYTSMQTRVQPSVKTVKAPDVTDYSDLIKVILANGDEATYNRGQVKSLCRKYFRNVLDGEAWMSGQEKRILASIGFRNLCAYFNAWKELDDKMPEFKDVLIYYHKHDKEGDTVKNAQVLYDKIISVLNLENEA